jgi:hypothetical protein
MPSSEAAPNKQVAVQRRRRGRQRQQRRHVGVEQVVREHEQQHHRQHLGHAAQAQHATQRQRRSRRLAGEIGQRAARPAEQAQAQQRHRAERPAPAPLLPEQGAGRHAQRQRQRRADHRHRDRAALLRRGHHPARVAGQQRPQQPGADPCEQARGQDQRIAGGDRGDRVGQREAGDGEQQQRAPPVAPGGGGERDRRQQRAERVERDQLADPGFADAQPRRHRRQQAGRQRFGEDGDEAGAGQREQSVPGKAPHRRRRGRRGRGRARHEALAAHADTPRRLA